MSIGSSILDFARITSRDESFDVTGYLKLIGFGFVTAAAATFTYVHVAVSQGRPEVARRIQTTARWLFLPAYSVAVGMNFYEALR